MEYNKLNNFYIALTEKECFRLPLNFLSNSFRLRLDYQPGFWKMNPHSKHKSPPTGIQAMEYTFR